MNTSMKILARFCVATCFSAVFAPIVVCSADDDPAVLTFEECAKLAPEQLLERIEVAYKQRIEHARNITFRTTSTLKIHEYSESGGVGTYDGEGFRFDHELWRIHDSYKVTADIFEPATAKSAVQFSQTGYDATNGVNRSRVSDPGDPTRIQARIDVAHDISTSNCRYLFWLEGPEEFRSGDYIIALIAENCRSGKLELDEQSHRIRLSIDWSSGPIEKHSVFELEPEKSFFPVEGSTTSKYRTTKFKVLEDQLVEQCWMPTLLKETISGTGLGPDRVNVCVTRAEKITQGEVSPEDLKVEFPKGTRVVDAIKKVAYTIGDGGDPQKIR